MPSSTKNNKNLILFVHKVPDYAIDSFRAYSKKTGNKYRLGLITAQALKEGELKKEVDVHIVCDTTSQKTIQKAILPYQDQVIALTSRGDDSIPLLSKVIPHFPYLRTPTPESLLWATDKILMRRRMTTYDKKITPRYTLVENFSKKSLQRIEKKVGYPAIIKPTGLSTSRLVTIVYHREELEKTLRRVFRTINGIYKEAQGRWEPKVLAEQFMEGEMYSFDAHVSSRGKVYFCPPVHTKTGRSIGFDDFFGYSQMTPTHLSVASIKAAEAVATKGIHALGLRSTSLHIELMKMEKGWKVIELGPRIGGFRHELYKLSYDIDLSMNDIFIRMPEKIEIPKKVIAHSVAMKFFAKKEGRLTKLVGIKKAQELKSFYKINVHQKIGDMCRYAKNGGASVFNIILSNPSRPKLLADMRRLEQMIKIETK